MYAGAGSKAHFTNALNNCYEAWSFTVSFILIACLNLLY